MDRINWKGYGRPDCKLTLRINPDPHTRALALVHDFHADIAENRLKHEGVKPALLAYVIGIGEAFR